MLKKILRWLLPIIPMNSDRKEEIRLKLMTEPLDADDLAEPGDISCMWDYTLTDTETSEVKFQSPEMECHSFTAGFMVLLYDMMNETPADLRITDISGIVGAPVGGSNWGCLRTVAAIGVVNMGIIVGSGSTAPTVSDAVIQIIIAHGTGAGQLSYSAMTYGAPASNASISQCTLTRNFANASGGAVSVNEIGLYVSTNSNVKSTVYLMVLHDVTGSISIPNGQTLTINYRPQVSI